jgi:hypothetical protein
MTKDSLTLVGEKRLRELLEHERQILNYCLNHTSFMWAATVAGIILECDFREVTYEKISKKLGIKKLDEARSGGGDE